MDRVLIALAIAVVAAAVALTLRARRADPPIRSGAAVPEQLDRADFASPAAPWLVAVFTSATCASCDDVRLKAETLESDEVAVDIAEFQTHREMHQRYRIDSVPLVLIADRDGVVRRHFLGPVSAADLWVAVADVRSG